MHRHSFFAVRLASMIAMTIALTGGLAFADAEPGKAAPEAAASKPAVEPEAAKPAPETAKPAPTEVAKPAAKLVCPACPASLSPVYVADWARLAALTQSDSQIFPEVEGFAQRHDVVRNITVAGVVLGGIATMVGGFHAVSADEWTRFDQSSVAGGLALTAVSLFIAWAMEPDRDDFYTLINQWNLRHPQQVLAP